MCNENEAVKAILEINPDLLESFLDQGLDANTRCFGSLLSHALRVYLTTDYDKVSLAPLPHNDAALRQVSLLLKHGADVNAPIFSGNTPLHFATVANGHVKKVDEPLFVLLLQHGADVSIKNRRGHTPLDLARGDMKVCLQRLVEQGVPIHPSALSALKQPMRPV